MKSHRMICAAAIALFCAAAQPAMSGNAEEIDKCANGINTGKAERLTVAGFKFKCPDGVVVSNDPLARGIGVFNNNHAYFEGAFSHLNPRLAADRVRFFITVENWNSPNCRIADPTMKIERRSKLLKIAEFIPNWKDWKSLPAKIDGQWEKAAFAISATAIRKWHERFEFARCKRDW
jgi:hypothetical protein